MFQEKLLEFEKKSETQRKKHPSKAFYLFNELQMFLWMFHGFPVYKGYIEVLVWAFCLYTTCVSSFAFKLPLSDLLSIEENTMGTGIKMPYRSPILCLLGV